MGATTIELTAENFKEVVDRDGIVVIDWWAPWCGPCRAFAPVFEEVAARHPDITFGKVNTEQEQGLGQTYEIRSIPTLMILRDRILLFAQPGALPAMALEDLIRQVKDLDMTVIKAQLAAEQQKTPAG
jgi:thioredoxin 1